MGPKLRKLVRGPMYFLAPGWPSHLSEPQLLGSRASQGCRMSRNNQAFIPVGLGLGLAKRVREAERQMGEKRTRKLTSVVTKTLKKI